MQFKGANSTVYFSMSSQKINMKRGEGVKKALTNEDREKRFAEDAWLNYFNRYLFEHGTITEKEYKKMTEIIATKKSKLSRNRSAT